MNVIFIEYSNENENENENENYLLVNIPLKIDYIFSNSNNIQRQCGLHKIKYGYCLINTFILNNNHNIINNIMIAIDSSISIRMYLLLYNNKYYICRKYISNNFYELEDYSDIINTILNSFY